MANPSLYRQANSSTVATRVRLAFDSVDAAVRCARDPQVVAEGKAAHLRDGYNRMLKDASWSGIAGLTADKLDALVRDGWPEGAGRLDRMAIEVPRCSSIRRRVTWGPAGDFVDQQRVWGGRLESAWSAARRRKVPATATKTLCVDIGDNCDTQAETLFWRGAAVLCLSDLLTGAGYNVEIIAVEAGKSTYGSSGTPADFTCTIVVKSALAPLEINSLAAVVCCAGFFRSVLFDLIALNPGAAASSSLGQHVTPEAAGLIPEGGIGGTSAIRDLTSARKWVLDSLTALGVDFEQREAA